MKKLILSILILTTVSLFAVDNSPYYSLSTHKIFENFVGKWDVIYANQSDKGAPAGGRGVATSKLNLGKTILECESYLDFELGNITTQFLIGYDKNKLMYYFISYDNAGETPALLWGEYLADSKTFEFKSYTGLPKNGDTRLVVELTREDKFKINSFRFENGKEKSTLDMGYIKK